MPQHERILGDLRIFQSIVNDIRLEHKSTPEGGVYSYTGIDPYQLEDSALPNTVRMIERYGKQKKLEAVTELIGALRNVISELEDTLESIEKDIWP